MNDLDLYAKTIFEPEDVIELRFIKKGKPPIIQKRWMLASELPDAEIELRRINHDGFDIYIGPNPRTDKGLSGDLNVKLARCLFCDFDHVEPGDGCGRFEFIYNDIFFYGLPEPTIAVHSGHGVHVYWRLDEPVLDLNTWRVLQERLNRRLGADQSIKNPERIMRLPGYKNVKRKPFEDCFVCWSSDYVRR